MVPFVEISRSFGQSLLYIRFFGRLTCSLMKSGRLDSMIIIVANTVSHVGPAVRLRNAHAAPHAHGPHYRGGALFFFCCLLLKTLLKV